MRFRLTAALIGLALAEFAGSARAQFGPGGFYGPTYGQAGPAGPYAPNFYNRTSQPLSPYLNLLRGNNPAVNYYYGVRPGTMPAPFQGGYNNGAQMGMQRQTFFPYVDTLAELEPTDPRAGIAPTGHPSGFNNTLGYFGLIPGAGRANQFGQGQQQGGAQPGTMSRPRR